MVDFDIAIKKPFTDFKKLIIGILLSIVPIVGWFARGFILECSGVGKNKKSKKMPEWTNWADLFVKGLIATVISLIYVLPAIFFFLIALIIGAFSAFGVFLKDVLPSLSEIGPASTKMLEQAIHDNWMYFSGILLTLTPLLLLGILFIILAGYLIPIATLAYLKTNNIGDAFQLKKVFRKAFTSDYLLVWLAVAVITILLQWLMSFIPIIGGSIASFIAGVFGYTLFGDVFLKK